MAKKKKSNKSKQKSPLPQNQQDGDCVNNGDGDHLPQQEHEEQIPKQLHGGEVKEHTTTSGTDLESEEGDDERPSQERIEKVPRDESLDTQLTEDAQGSPIQKTQPDDIQHENNHSENDVMASKNEGNMGSIDDETEVDNHKDEETRKETHEIPSIEKNLENNVAGENHEPREDTHETNGERETILKSEENNEPPFESNKAIEMDQKQESEHLETPEYPVHLSTSTTSETRPKESTPEGSIINESRSELHLEALTSNNSPAKPATHKPNVKPTKLVNASPGPYSVLDIISEIPSHNPDIKGSENAYPTYVEKLDSHIYIGTSHGEILHFFKIDDEFTLVSRNSFHQSRIRPISKILLLPKIEKALVIAGGLLSCFLLPEFSPANIGRVKEVNDISLDFDNKAKNDGSGVHVAVYTNNQIRIINVTPTAFRLVKDIAYSDSRKGLRRSEYSLVASRENYDLIDLENFQKIPLFPILTLQDDTETGSERKKPLTPFILPVGQEEFLLTCGISKEEPSMGLVINLNGDISRGTIPLAKYPDSLGINYPYVVSTFDKAIAVNSLHDQSEVQSLEFTGNVQVTNVSSSFVEPYADLVGLIKLIPLIGEDQERESRERDFVSKISTINTSLVCFCSNFIKILLPQPRLIRLKNLENIAELEDELKSVDGSTELGVVELEYINLLIGLIHLRNKTYQQGFEIWTNGTVDPRILIYIFQYRVYGDIWIFNGLKDLTEELKTSIKDTKFKKFFVSFLDKWIAKESYTENTDLVKSIELANLKESLHDNSKLMRLAESDLELILDETIEILKENGKHCALAKIYTKQGKFKEVLQIYKDLGDGHKKDATFNKDEGLTAIIDLVYKHFSDDEDLVWEVGLWLINKKPELGLNFFQNDGLNIKIKDETLLISKIDDISLKYKYIQKLLVRLNKDKMRSSLVKNLHKTELRNLNDRMKKYRSHVNQ